MIFCKALVVIGKYLVPLFTSEPLGSFTTVSTGTSEIVLFIVALLGTKIPLHNEVPIIAPELINDC